MDLEITVSAYFVTSDASVAIRINEQLNRMVTGFALEGGVETAVRVSTSPPEENQDSEAPA